MVSGSSKGQLLPKGWEDMVIPRGPAGQGLPQPGSVPLPPVRELGRLGCQPVGGGQDQARGGEPGSDTASCLPGPWAGGVTQARLVRARKANR